MQIRFDGALPYPSQRQPLFARNVVATSQPLAAQAGLAMLARGGNAIDAAIATAIALTVVEPTTNGIGSDLFAIVWDGEKLIGLNASGRSPAAWSHERFASRDVMPTYGWDAVTIPGAVAGWSALSQRFGELPFEDLFEPAIRYARDGFQVAATISALWQRAAKVLPHDLGFAEHFLPAGRAPEAGELFRCASMAETLMAIAKTHGNAFYRGHLAAAMVAHAEANQGAHTLEDFAAHTVDWVAPITMRYRDLDVHEIPPNGQGIAALMALAMLRDFDLASLSPDSVASQHLCIEAMKLAFADAHAFVTDANAMTMSPRALLDADYLSQRARLIDGNRAQQFSAGRPPSGGTVYLATGDARGRMVSLIQSNYMGFGAGVVVPGTGISLQNRGHGFSLTRGHPNIVEGNKRPFHTIIPGFVTHEGKPLAAFGVMGGAMQPQGHVQTITRLADHRMNAQAVLDAPRWRSNGGLALDLELTADASLHEGLAALGHRITVPGDRLGFGCGQFVVKIDDGYMAGSDPRRDGYPVGF
ncbi:MAG TPA: gamma-glutamyltransferase family protein [Casimicrobiaceae bacterium]|nr:gamma-glutamyltransferase family protein [Casimicrobiaceae bacterium]